MTIRERAAADAQNILTDINGAATPFVLIAADDGQEYPISGSYGDIGYLIDPATGTAIQGRTIEAAYSMATLREQTKREPEKGWRFVCNDLEGNRTTLFVVLYVPDRTIGLARLKLAVDME
jgi:hypothetical protein